MRKTIPRPFIQNLVCRIDIVDIVKSRIQLTKEQPNNSSALCPFHREKTPSFSVSRDKQFYYCFGCGAHGNVINFLMEFDHLDFVSAIEILAQHAGITIPYEQTDNKQYSNLPAIETCIQQVVQFYEKHLKANDKVIQYLKSRDILGKTAKYFHLGASPNQWHAVVQHFKAHIDLLKQAGLILEGKAQPYDRFRNRLMFPIRNIRGQFIGFGARTLSNEPPKYLNSPETVIFHKNQELYGLYEVLKSCGRKVERILIVEGYMDVISLFQSGIQYAVATLGTALNAKHLHKLLRYTKKLVFCFAGDDAGKMAAKKASSIALSATTHELKTSFMFLPKKEDPDSLIKRIGKCDFEKLIDQAIPLSDFFFRQIREEIPLTSVDDRALFAKEVIKRLQQVPNGIFKTLLEKKLLTILQISQEQLDQWLFTPISGSTQKPLARSVKIVKLPKKMHPAFSAIAILLNNPELIKLIDDPLAFTELSFKYNELLTTLLSLLKQKPDASVGYLLTVIDETHHRLIIKLSTLTLPKTAHIEAEFIGAIKRLHAIKEKQIRQKLIDTAKKRPLTSDEKQRLKALLYDNQEGSN